MMVSQKEIIEELRGECNGCKRDMLADRIEAEGIAPDSSVDALIAEAVAKEREACAKLCDAIAGNPKDFFEQFRRGAGRCAADIRARGQK